MENGERLAVIEEENEEYGNEEDENDDDEDVEYCAEEDDDDDGKQDRVGAGKPEKRDGRKFVALVAATAALLTGLSADDGVEEKDGVA